MSQILSSIPKLRNPLDEWDDGDPTPTPMKIDRMVADGRSVRSPEVEELRAQPRLSIAELNERDVDEIRSRLARTQFDNRGPVEKFLDIIDLPRNTIVGALAPGIRKRKEAEGETGAFGRGRVYVSDVLNEMGVRPGITSAVLGFVGDVAFDPLTYVGPAGWGAKVATTGGKAVRIGAQGTRAARSAIKAVSKGRPIADDLTRAVVEHATRDMPGATAEQLTERAGKAFFGHAETGIAERLKRGDIFQTRGAGSDIAESTLRPALDGGDPYKAWLDRYGEGFQGEGGGVRFGPKGIGFGNAQSAIAHIPFTEIGFYIPAVTANGKMRRVARAVSLAKNGDLVTTKAMLDVQDNLREIAALDDTHRAWAARREGVRAKQPIGLETHDPELVQGIDQFDLIASRPYTGGDNLRSIIDAKIAGIRTAREEALGRLHRAASAAAQSPNLGVSDLLNLSRQVDVAESMIRAQDAQAAAMPFDEIVRSKRPTEAMFRASRNRHLEAVKANAEAELELPQLREQLAAATESDEAVRLERAIAHRELQVPTVMARLTDNEAADAVYRMASKSDDELFEIANRTDLMHSAMEAQKVYADTIKGSMLDTMTEGQRVAADTAAYLLGLGPDDFKPGPLMSMLNASRAILGNDENGAKLLGGLETTRAARAGDARWRAMWGDRGSRWDNLRRNAEAALQSGAPYETQAAAGDVIREMRRVAVDHGIDSPEKTRKFMAVITARQRQKLAQARPQDFPETWVNAAGEEVPHPTAQAIMDAADSGLVSAEKNPAFLADVDRLADMLIDQYRAMSPDTARETYTPNRLTPQWSKAALQKRQTGYNVASTADRGLGVAPETFEKARSTDYYQWRDADGKLKQAFEFDLRLADYWKSPEGRDALTALDPERRAAAADIIANADEFAKAHPGLDAESRWMRAKPADAFLLNEIAPKRFAALIGGGKISERMFSDDALYLLMRRQSEQIKASAHKAFQDLFDRETLDLAQRYAQVEDMGPLGKRVTFMGGTKGYVLRGGQDFPAMVQIGEQAYRPLDQKLTRQAFTTDSLMNGVLDARSMVRYLPEQLATKIERAAEAGSGESLNQIVRFADKFTGLWKSLTLLHPSWPVINVVGMAWQIAAGRIPLDLVLKHLKDAWRITASKGDLSRLAETRTFAGRSKPLSEIAIETHGQVGSSGRTADIMRELPATGRFDYPGIDTRSRWQRLKALPRQLKSEWLRSMELHLDQYDAARAANPIDKLRVSARMLRDEVYVRRFIQPFFRANALAEDWIRTASYMALLDQGLAPAEAAAKIREVLFDFNDLTKFERNVRRWAIPFFAWMRNAGGYALSNVLQNPKWVGMAPKLKQAIEEAAAGESALPEHLRPSFLREQLAIQLGTDPEARTMLTVGSALPTEAANIAGGAVAGGAPGVMNLVRWLTGGLNPAISIPLQLGAGREFYTGREIGAREFEGDLSAGEFLRSQVRPVRELVGYGSRPGSLTKAFESGVGAGAARLLVGGRAQPAGDERLLAARQRELDDRANNIRKAIAIAEREGDQERSLRARVKLLELYRAGGESNLKVPKWSQRELQSVAR